MATAKEEAKKKCFVITPIGSENDPIRRHIDGIIDAAITPTLGEKYEIVVAHRIATSGSITKQVIEEIYRDELAIANLTTKNPNVMYELAFRHSLGSPVIIIAEKGTDIPFDISDERVIFYQNDAQGVLDLCEQLKSFESKINFDDVKKSGLIYDLMREIDHDAQIVEAVKQSKGESQGIGESLLYILQKLDSIDGKVTRVSQKKEIFRNTTHYTSTISIFYSDSKDLKIDREKIIDKIYAILSSTNIYASLKDVDISQIGIIKIKIDYTDESKIDRISMLVYNAILNSGIPAFSWGNE